jgi:C_GCAxxG_C_C family probable redox protein
MRSRIETAAQRFVDGYNCAQAVFTAYAPSFGVSETDALRIATGFGGGMGHLQEVCGAVTGAFMVIGGCCGMRQPADKAAKDMTYSLVHELGKRFASLHGQLLCRSLLGCDLNTTEGKAQFKEQKLRDTKCVVYVRDACRLLEEMLPEQAAV